MTITWAWLEATYMLGGWRIVGARASGTRDRQELVLTLERQVPACTAEVRFDVELDDPADWEGFEEALARWRGHDVD